MSQVLKLPTLSCEPRDQLAALYDLNRVSRVERESWGREGYLCPL